MSSKKKVNIQEKYPPMSPEDIVNEEKATEAGKAKLSMEMSEVEEALTDYLSISDPVVYKGKAIMWIHRPTVKQLKQLIPPEMRDYIGSPEKVPEETGNKYEAFFYEKLAEMVTVPKYTAEQWKEKANPWLLRLFWEHIAKIAQMMEGEVEGF